MITDDSGRLLIILEKILPGTATTPVSSIMPGMVVLIEVSRSVAKREIFSPSIDIRTPANAGTEVREAVAFNTVSNPFTNSLFEMMIFMVIPSFIYTT